MSRPRRRPRMRGLGIYLWSLSMLVRITGKYSLWIFDRLQRVAPPQPKVMQYTPFSDAARHVWDVVSVPGVTPTGKIGGSGAVEVECSACHTELTKSNFMEVCPGPKQELDS